jgi:serine phosphatase RsbU (regulator of sigma subunit)
MHPELLIQTAEGDLRTVALDGARQGLGRSSSNELYYPDDAGLSRQHLVFEAAEGGWTVRDLGSKNGTYVNGSRISAPHRLKSGDKVHAGHLAMEFVEPVAAPAAMETTPAAIEKAPAATPQHTVMFVEDKAANTPKGPTVRTSLQEVLEAAPKEVLETPEGAPHVAALIRAGRELAGHRPLEELFEVILDLAMQAVNAARGVLMTLEGEELSSKAARGDGFRISSAVRDCVLRDRISLLVKDAQLEEAFRNRMSIVTQRVRSMMAVPLQSNERVIGLIYVDSPDLMNPFDEHDLNLLTVMANVAAIRIEHARLVQVEQAERIMAKELEQAAEIQRRLLPSEVPAVPGFDLAGHNAACRGVGGDYYDFVPLPDGRFAFLVADVSGKGMPAAMLMSSLQSRVQMLLEEPSDLASMTARLNRTLKKSCPANRFVTFFLCALDPVTGTVSFCNAGHNPPLLVRASGSVERLDQGGGLPLAMFPVARYEEHSCHLDPGDAIVLYSDGVSEAPRPGDGEEFGEDRLAELLIRCRFAPAQTIISTVIDAVGRWTEGAPPADDITLVIGRRLF